MAKGISDETVELIRTAHELGLSLDEGAPFAGVSRGTLKAWRKKLGLKSPIKQHGENQWSKSDVDKQLETILAEEGIIGLRSNTIGKRHPEVRSAAVSRYGSYSAAGEAVFGFPLTRPAMDVAEYIHDRHESGEEIERRGLFGRKSRMPFGNYYEAIYRFATGKPATSRRTEKEILEVLAKTVLAHFSKPGSYVTPGTRNIFPAPYRSEADNLFDQAVALGLVVEKDGAVGYYTAGKDAVQKARQMLLKTEEYKLFELPSAAARECWSSLLKTESPGGDAARRMEKSMEGLSGRYRVFAQSHLIRSLFNKSTFDPSSNTYKPDNGNFRRGAILSDAINRYKKGGAIDEELYTALQSLLPEDDNAINTLGENFLRRPKEPKSPDIIVPQKGTGAVYATTPFARNGMMKTEWNSVLTDEEKAYWGDICAKQKNIGGWLKESVAYILFHNRHLGEALRAYVGDEPTGTNAGRPYDVCRIARFLRRAENEGHLPGEVYNIFQWLAQNGQGRLPIILNTISGKKDYPVSEGIQLLTREYSMRR